MGSIRSDLRGRIFPEPIDHFDRLPDSVILLIFNQIGDVKALGRCCVVSRRFHDLVPQVDNVVVRVDCVAPPDLLPLPRPFLRTPEALAVPVSAYHPSVPIVTHHSPTQVLKNFNEIKLLRIELPSGELGIDDGVLLKWKANFGSTLDRCIILGASSVIQNTGIAVKCMSSCNSNDCVVNNNNNNNNSANSGVDDDNGSIPESFYTNGGLKLRVVWTISSLIAASARHYLLQPIIAEHKTLENLVLTDADGQGVLSMNKEQLEELRVKPLSASSASKRTLVPALNMRLWYASHLELPNGVILKGATLVAIRPSEQPKKEVMGSEGDWVSSAFDEPFGTAVRMLAEIGGGVLPILFTNIYILCTTGVFGNLGLSFFSHPRWTTALEPPPVLLLCRRSTSWSISNRRATNVSDFQQVTCNMAAPEDETTAGVYRLEELKISKMNYLVLKKPELEDFCRKTCLIPVPDGSIDIAIDAVDILQISEVKEEAFSRKESLKNVEKWSRT
ncbi:F-box family protein [Striga asiatica]|uniref:F-box family protein n=1 Tax=Striga asiatica TaxID=4170 RepID=A0A5A7PVG0_STRAF|nr:F-box family protein [Striga asiatica]